MYESPKGVANALGEVRKAGERKTAPFMSFWYIGADLRGREMMVKFWREAEKGKVQGQDVGLLCKGIQDLPHAMRDSFDPLRKVGGVLCVCVCVYVCVYFLCMCVLRWSCLIV
jgi:hypothetical protein